MTSRDVAFDHFHKLLKTSPVELLPVLDSYFNQHPQPQQINQWLGVKDHALTKLYLSRDLDAIDINLAKVVLAIYTYLASNSEAFLHDLMHFKTWLLANLSPKDLIGLASIEEIITWFLERLPYSLEEAITKTTMIKADWSNATQYLMEMREIRFIKRRIIVIQLLQQFDQIQQNPELQRWIKVKEQLI